MHSCQEKHIVTLKRRDFLAYSGVAGLFTVGITDLTSNAEESKRDILELRKYTLDNENQRQQLEAFMAEAAIPALNRLNIAPVGLFFPSDKTLAAYMLLRHPSAQSVLTAPTALLADSEFVRKGSAFLDAPAQNSAYKRVESSLLWAIEGMPQLERPVSNPGRVFQLRIYESPSLKTNLKKIEMFNKAELNIFRKTGLNPVFFGQTLIGSSMPNLTYMLTFNDMEQQKKAWDSFLIHPDWLTLRAIPEYADKSILSGITNILLTPADCSQL